MLETINQKWLDLIQQATKITKKEEEEKYEKMVNDKQGILHIINSSKEAIITLNLYYDDFELALQREKLTVTKGKEVEKPSSIYHSTINLPQLPLPTFSGDPKLWREFWNSFNAAIHLQGIPNIQKLTYLTSCLKGEALEAIRGFDIAPENYELIRQVLIDKYGNPATIKKSLYNEFYSIQRNDREWKSRVEAMEKILRQLEALGEDLEHSSIEVTIESRLPPWILDKVYQMKTEGETWTISKLRQFLMVLIQRNEEVNRNQKPRQELIPKRAPHYQKGGETSALSITKQFKSTEARNLQLSNKTKFNKEKRPCIFCNKNHWDNECPNCLTVKQRFERLKELKACSNCFRTMHATSDCKQRKRTCFHCKGQHNTALCYKKYGSLNNGSNNEETNSTIIINSLNQPINYQGKKVLLICKEIEAVNPTQLEIQEEALVLFDSGSQSSFISKKLANRLSLTETKKEELKLFSFGNQFPKLYQTSKVKFGIRALKSNIIPINAYVLDYLTDKLQIINPTSYDINYITNQKQLDDSEGYWRRPDIIIGADHFFEFMQPYKVHRMSSGFYLLQTKVGPIITGCGYTNMSCKSDSFNINSINVTTVITNQDIDQFWKLEVIGIQEQPNEHDDEKALEQFKNCITKENNRYQVSWPWKDSKINLQDNYGLCYGRLRTLIKRLQTNPSLLECYDEIIKEQLQSNIIENVTTNMDQEETYGSATALEIKKNLYVDNVILPVNGTQEAFKIYKEMKDIFKNASMNIRERDGTRPIFMSTANCLPQPNHSFLKFIKPLLSGMSRKSRKKTKINFIII
uniref:DUF1758 domain-containing protein n=1 Tax=Loa loa TaxID=7209 RepID=A0A1I7VL35_LOALO